MKSTTTHPAIVDPDRPVPLQVTVVREDIDALLDDTLDLKSLLLAAGVVAGWAARKNGYHIEEIRTVEADGDEVYLDTWATAAPLSGGSG